MGLTGELERHLSQAQARALLEAVTGLDDAGLRAARTWYRDVGWATARNHSARDDVHFVFSPERRSCALGLAVALSSTPRDAVRRCDWRRWWATAEPEYLPDLATLLAARGRDWCSEFVRLSAQTRSSDRITVAEEIACLSLPLIARFDLPVPEGDTYVRGWTAMVRRWWARGASRFPSDRPGLAPIAFTDDVAGYVPGATAGLRPLLEATPRLQDTLAGMLQAPFLLSELQLAYWTAGTRPRDATPGWLVGETLVDLANDGALVWDEFFVALVAALPRLSHSSMVVGVALLDRLELTPERLRPHLGFLINAMPQLPGPATAALLPAVLRLDPAGAELLDLGTTILTRPEKAQKTVLLKHLATRPVVDPVVDPGVSAVDELLELAAGSEDSRLAAAARAALAKRSGRRAPARRSALEVATSSDRPEGSIEIAWDGGSTGGRGAATDRSPATPAFRPAEHSPSGIAACYEELMHAPAIATQARLLDALANVGNADVALLRRVVQSLPPRGRSHPRFYDQLKHWGESGEPVTGRRRPESPWSLLDQGLIGGVLAGFDARTFLLSTPSREDGVLEWDALVTRIGLLATGRARGRIGTWDAVRALLRLELPPVERLGELDAFRGGHRATHLGAAPLDLVDIVADWVRSGGLPVREVRPQPYRTLPEVYSQVPPETVGKAPIGVRPRAPEPGVPWVFFDPYVEDGHVGGFAAPGIDPAAVLDALDWASPKARTAVAGLCDPVPCADHRIETALPTHAAILGVTPFAVELLAASGVGALPDSRLLGLWRSAAGPFGLAVHHRLAQLLVVPDPALRTEAVATVTELAARGLLDAALLEGRCLELAGDGEFSLSRAATSFDQAILAGAGAAVWPSLAGVLDVAGGRSGAGLAGLAEFLRVATRYAAIAVRHHPERAVPAGVRALAATGSTSKAAAEARTYCADADAAAAVPAASAAPGTVPAADAQPKEVA